MLRPASRLAHHFTRGSLQWLSLIAIEVNPSHATTTGSPVALINSDRGKPLSRHHHWIRACCVLRCWEDVVVVWRMRDPDVVMTWEWWRGWWYRWWLDVRMKFVGHVLRSCEQIMWVVMCQNLVTITLQLPSFLDASSVERRSCLLMNGNSVKNLPTLWRSLRKKTGRKWEHFSSVRKLMNLKGSCH